MEKTTVATVISELKPVSRLEFLWDTGQRAKMFLETGPRSIDTFKNIFFNFVAPQDHNAVWTTAEQQHRATHPNNDQSTEH